MLAGCTTKSNSQMDAAAELESHMFGFSGDVASCENETNFTDYAKQSNELGHTRMSGTGGGDVHQMLAEHTIISEAFLSATTCSWFEKDKALLASLLNSLQSLWAQPQWQACLKDLCCHGEFRRSMLKIVKLFEEELKKHRVETDVLHESDQISYSTLTFLVSLIIPPLLKLIRFVHTLWMDETVFRFPEELI
uniref:Exportin-5 C-terminal domain-containing protein n=1 Tax=Oryza brachyantha TaxID=4533 RepID=J3N8N1_ORYBR